MSTHIEHISKIYLRDNTNEITSIINTSIDRISEYLAYNLTYIYLGKEMYSSLYVNAEKHMATLATGLYLKLEIFKLLRKKLAPVSLVKVLSDILNSLMNAWLLYMMIFLVCNKGEEMVDLPSVIQEDMNQVKEFFIASAGDESSYTEKVTELLKPMKKFINYIKADDNTLMGVYRKIGTQNDIGKELITRILYGRHSKNVERFFELYRNIVIK